MGRLNFLYLLGPLSAASWENNEIRYSLRSLEATFDIGWVGIVGPEMPPFLTGVEHLQVELLPGQKFRNLLNQLHAAMLSRRVPEDLILMNDDFMVRPTPVWDWTPTHMGLIPEQPKSKRQWHRSVHATGEWLKNTFHGSEPPLNYEGHTPMPIYKSLARTTLSYLLMETEPLQFRSAYGNMWHIGGKQHPNAKRKDPNKWPDETPFWSLKSTPDKAAKKFLEDWLPKPSRFEKEA
jgi:hypothetical protein